MNAWSENIARMTKIAAQRHALIVVPMAHSLP